METESYERVIRLFDKLLKTVDSGLSIQTKTWIWSSTAIVLHGSYILYEVEGETTEQIIDLLSDFVETVLLGKLNLETGEINVAQ